MSTNTSPYQSVDGVLPDPYKDVGVMIFVVCSIVIMIVDFVGNSTVVVIVARKHRMQTYTNYLIFNLAIADLLVALIVIPVELPIELKFGQWVYDEFFCAIFYPFQTVTVCASVFTLVVLSTSRYWAVLHPFAKQPGKKFARNAIFVIWISSFGLVIPYILVLKYDEHNKTCSEDWNERQKRIYTITNFIFQYLLPILIISIANIRIIFDLCFREKKMEGHSFLDKRKQAETRKVVKLLIILTITFALCVLPYHLCALIMEIAVIPKFIYDIAYLMLYLNSALNPIIYITFNQRFRHSFAEFYKTLVAYLTRNQSELDDNKNFFRETVNNVNNSFSNYMKNRGSSQRPSQSSSKQSDSENMIDLELKQCTNLLLKKSCSSNLIKCSHENGVRV